MPNHTIALVTDSTCDIPADLRKQYAIHVVPLSVIWGNEVLLEGIDIQPEAFYQRLVSDPQYPTTSQPTPEAFLKVYDQAQADGAESVVVITISSAMSGTMASAKLASEMTALPVTVVDSRANSMSLGWQVLAAARSRETGGDAAAMIAAANRVRERLSYLIVLDTLRYLHKGGRIGGASAFIGTVLNLKPQIWVNHQTGEVEAGKRTRTRKKSLNTMYDDFFAQLPSHKRLRIAVLHNAALPEAREMAERVKKEYAPEELVISIVSPVLGVHTGPKAIALCGYAEGAE